MSKKAIRYNFSHVKQQESIHSLAQRGIFVKEGHYHLFTHQEGARMLRTGMYAWCFVIRKEALPGLWLPRGRTSAEHSVPGTPLARAPRVGRQPPAPACSGCGVQAPQATLRGPFARRPAQRLCSLLRVLLSKGLVGLRYEGGRSGVTVQEGCGAALPGVGRSLGRRCNRRELVQGAPPPSLHQGRNSGSVDQEVPPASSRAAPRSLV